MRRAKFILLFTLWAPVLPVSAFPQSSEYVMKAVYLEKFTQFVDWPPESGMANLLEPFVIGMIGETPLESTVKELYSTQKIKNKPVEIRSIADPSEALACNLLFISNSQGMDLEKILAVTGEKPILTVGDTKGYAKRGVHINFDIIENKIRFEINEEAVKKAGLEMSHLLLGYAVIVKSGGMRP